MAKLPAAFNPISVSQINTLKGYGGIQTSMADRERDYMGGNPLRANVGICFQNQVELNFASGTYTGSQVAWQPTRFSEFYDAYNGKPTVSVSSGTTGNRHRANFFASVGGSECPIAGNYQVYATPVAGSISGAGLNAWLASAGTYSWPSMSVGGGTVTLRVYVQDACGCGRFNEFFGQDNYP
jgi:hypothetical protein